MAIFGLIKTGLGLVSKVTGFDMIGSVVGIGKDWLKNKRKLAGAKQDTEMKIELSKQRVIAKQATADIDKDLIFAKDMKDSWKDELWTIGFFYMFMSAFFDPERLKAGLLVLGEMDTDMKYLMGVVIGTAFAAAEVRKTYGRKK